MDLRKTGIYSIYSEATGYYYIGFTQQGFLKRFIWHLTNLTNKKVNSKMQDDFEKYGLYNLKLLPLEIIEDKPLSYYKMKEEYWTLKYLSEGKQLYNKKIVDKFINGKSGCIHTEDFKKMLSEKYSNKGNPMYGRENKWGKHTEETKKKIRLKTSKFTIEEYEQIYMDLMEDTGELFNVKYKRLKEKWKCGEDMLKRIKSGRHWSCEHFSYHHALEE